MFGLFFAMLKKSEAFISLFFLPRRWVVLESQADRDKWHGCQFWDLSSYDSAACLHQGPSMQAKFIGQVAWLSILRTMGNEGFAMAAKKICKPWIPYKMTIKINQVIPYKMKGPNPAMVSNCISRFLYDSDSILKSSILLLLQYDKVQVGSLQNGLWNGPWGPSN